MTTSPRLQDAVTSIPGTEATAVAWRQKGQLHVTVIAKATFAFAMDAPMRRVDPQPIVRAEVHHSRNPGRSVRFTSDLAPFLARADVLFTGHAHAPPGGPVREVKVRLAVFDDERPVLDKRLVVCSKEPFSRMPIMYERAFGGLGLAENPLGVGAGSGTEEPNVIDPAAPRSVAGFGPLGRALPARKKLLGSLRRDVLEQEIAEIPESFAWAYFQAAPADQRIDGIRGDEWIVLEGLHPTEARVRTRLPGARAVARIRGLAGFGRTDGESLLLAADTLRIDGEQHQCTVVWRGSFTVPDERALGAVRVLAGVEVEGEAADGRTEESTTVVVTGETAAGTMIMPFRATSSPSPLATARSDAPREAAREPESSGTVAILPDPPPGWRSVLPFSRGAESAAASGPPSGLEPTLMREAPATEPPPMVAPPAIAAPDPRPARKPAPRAAKPPSSQIGPKAPSPELQGGLYGKFGKG